MVFQVKVSILVNHGGDEVPCGLQGRLVHMPSSVHMVPDGNAACLKAVHQELVELTVQIQCGNPQQGREELCPDCHFQQGKVSGCVG